jgi:hypothetical protein
MRRERECGGKKEIMPERRRGEEREPDKSEKRGREARRERDGRGRDDRERGKSLAQLAMEHCIALYTCYYKHEDKLHHPPISDDGRCWP